MLTLTEFLLARIAEDEAVAKAAGEAPWVSMETAPWVQVDPAAIHEEKWRFGQQGHVATAEHGEHATHIALHDPARVLAECEAKRRIVELVGPAHDERDEPIPGSGLPDVLAALALPYADHEQFQEEWRV